MKKRKKIIIGVIIVVVLCLLLMGTFLVFQLIRRGKTPPLIQIQQPVNQAQLPAGKGIIIHASADAQDGLEKMELWVDNALISEKRADQGEVVSKLVLSAGWIPDSIGKHTIIVRTTTKQGVTGQASVTIDAVERTDQPVVTYTLQPEDTLESIAEAHDLTEDDITSVNEGLDLTELEAGDTVNLPEEEPAVPSPFEPPSGGSESPTPTEESEPDPGTADPPEPAIEVDPLWLEFLRLFPIEIPIQLQIEVLSLQTEDAYNFLHCYASLAGADPRWVPDADHDQTTDESFISIGGAGSTWDVAEHFAQEEALNLSWSTNQPVPLDINCVGIVEGGMEAIELGRVEDAVEPERWGIAQTAYSMGGESSFRITYQVSHPAKGLDTSITPPVNVRINEADQKLLWDYPTEEIDAIDGFAVLLNDTLQWTVYPSRLETALPQEWFTLPCGDEYHFTVIAFRMDYPDGDYSLPSDPAVISGDELGGEGCGRTVVITFETLTTGDLGRNPSPVYGSFFANDQVLEFDGRPIEDDNFPSSFGLSQNETYNISRIMRGFGDNQTQLVVELPPGRWDVSELLLWVGFDIYKGGEKVCSGDVSIPEERFAGTYSGAIETDYPVGRMPDWCVVNYTIEPVGETPVVDPGAPPPLPDLVVQKFSVDPSSGRPRIHIRNVGQATWVNKPIVAEVTNMEGEPIGIYEWPNNTLEPGEIRIFSHGGLNPVPPLGICVLLDPENAVEEVRDRLVTSGILGEKSPYCRPLPDLSITDVKYDDDISSLRIELQNWGALPRSSADTGGSLDLANLLVWLEFEEGRPLTQRYEELNLEPHDNATLIWPLSELERERMRSGYTVVLNPDNGIAESDTENNSFQVEPTAKLRLVWSAGSAYFCETGNLLLYGENVGGKNTWDMELTASVSGGGSTQVVASWQSPELELTWRDEFDSWCRMYKSDWFEVAGDQVLNIVPIANLDITAHGFRWFSGGAEVLSAADDFGGAHHVPPDTEERCFENGVYFAATGPDGVCGPITCGWLGQEGVHNLGHISAYSDDITSYCWWSTTYSIFWED